jgi:N-acetyl sugar amidotransferase
MMSTNYRRCSRCVMDTTDPQIVFSPEGYCNHCSEALARIKREDRNDPESLHRLVERVKLEGKNKQYDCIIGLSGGVDSSYVAYQVMQLGLRPLAIHFDNGWNSELAVANVQNIVEKLKIDLFTHVVDWGEFKDFQLSLIRSGVANCEAPTDHAINALLFKQASRIGTRFILNGSNLASESIMPVSWGYYNQDLKLLKAIHQRFGKKKLKTTPLIGFPEYFFYIFVKRIKQMPFLNYLHYDKQEAKKLLTEKIDWRDYGGKHYESVWTRFFQGHYLPTRFGFDKRKAHYSSLICSGQMTREEALDLLELPIYDVSLLQQDLDFVAKKFGMTVPELDAIMVSPTTSAYDFPNNSFFLDNLRKYKEQIRVFATSNK